MRNHVHVTVAEALARASTMVGRIGLPQPWADWGQRAKSAEDGTPNDCMYYASWCLKDNGGRVRSDYRNGSIKAFRADRGYPEVGRASGAALTADLVRKAGIRAGDLLLLRWEDSGLPDHIGIVTSVNRDGSVNTIEANTGPSVGVYTPCGVHRRTRFPQNIVGAIRPPYQKAA